MKDAERSPCSERRVLVRLVIGLNALYALGGVVAIAAFLGPGASDAGLLTARIAISAMFLAAFNLRFRARKNLAAPALGLALQAMFFGFFDFFDGMSKGDLFVSYATQTAARVLFVWIVLKVWMEDSFARLVASSEALRGTSLSRAT